MVTKFSSCSNIFITLGVPLFYSFLTQFWLIKTNSKKCFDSNMQKRWLTKLEKVKNNENATQLSGQSYEPQNCAIISFWVQHLC